MTVAMTPDGYRYEAMGRRQRVCLPFQLRWFQPWICRANKTAWAWHTRFMTLLLGCAAHILGSNLASWEVGAAAALLVLGLPMVSFNWAHPVLVDTGSMAWAVLAAAMATRSGGPTWWLVIVAACLSGAYKETGPIFAAIFAWSWVPLIGLIVPALTLVYLYVTGGPGRDVLDPVSPAGAAVAHPFREAYWAHRNSLSLDGAAQFILPWGACLLALGALEWQIVAALGVAYLQLVTATDEVRLYQWAAPVVAIAAVGVVPVEWLPLVVALHWVNPWKGDGI